MDPEIKTLFQMVLEGQRQTDKIVSNLATAASSMVEAVTNLTATVNGMAITVNSMAVTVDKYVQASDARMKRLEENLDGLIRAITSEHSNGKAK